MEEVAAAEERRRMTADVLGAVRAELAATGVSTGSNRNLGDRRAASVSGHPTAKPSSDFPWV